MSLYSVILIFWIDILFASASRHENPKCASEKSLLPDPNTLCCGRNVLDNQGLLGSQDNGLDEIPWFALLQMTFRHGNNLSVFTCGGSLISHRYVLTAAHCLMKSNITLEDVNAEFAVYNEDCLMETDLSSDCIEHFLAYGENVIVHQNFNAEKLVHDIALVRLQDYSPPTYIPPICLPTFNIGLQKRLDLPLVVAGWAQSGSYASNTKESFLVQLVPYNECRRSYLFLNHQNICASGRAGIDTVKGDSGSPLMMISDGSYYITGIVSGRRPNKDSSKIMPSLYTNVFRYIYWIKNNIRI